MANQTIVDGRIVNITNDDKLGAMAVLSYEVSLPIGILQGMSSVVSLKELVEQFNQGDYVRVIGRAMGQSIVADNIFKIVNDSPFDYLKGVDHEES